MPLRFVILLLAYFVFALPVALSACTSSKAGDCQDACSHQAERTFCDIDGVYPGTNRKDECIAPPSPDACNRIESCPEGQVCTDDSMGICVECLVSEDCGDGQSCSSNNTCVADSCTPGEDGDAACLASNPDLPLCGPDKSCVACISDSDCGGVGVDASVCDQEDFECRGCVANSECESKVCGLMSGVCATEDDLVHVAKTGTDGASCGTLGSPCLTIAAGLVKVTAERNTVLIGAGEYAEKVVLASAVSLVGHDSVNINPALGDGEVAVLVSGPSDVHIDGIDIALTVGGSTGSVALQCNSFGGSKDFRFARGTVSGSGGIGVVALDCATTITESTISGNGHEGILAQGDALSITRSSMSGNARSGIQVQGCALTVTRSTITDNASTSGVGINNFNSDFEIANNIIVNNGSASTGTGAGGVVIRNFLEMEIQVLAFNTIAVNRAGSTTSSESKASNVHCEVRTPMVASANIIVGGQGGNSQGPLPNLFASNCSFEYSDIEGGPAGTGNIDADPLFVNPIAGAAGDFHLQSNSPCIDAADPAATLNIDLDGETRPQGGGHDMGADEAQ